MQNKFSILLLIIVIIAAGVLAWTVYTAPAKPRVETQRDMAFKLRAQAIEEHRNR